MGNDPWDGPSSGPSDAPRQDRIKVAPTDPIAPLEDIFLGLARRQERASLRPLATGVSRMVTGALDALPGGKAVGRAIAELMYPPIVLAPANASQAEKYTHYERMLIARGFTLEPGGTTVVALRGISDSGQVHATTSGASYDDTMVVLKRDAQGNPQVTTLAGSTHADGPIKAVGGTVGVPDVTVPKKDGKADVGMLNPGEYRLVRRADHNGAEAWDVRTLDNSGAVPGARDTNQDGVYSDAERSASRDAGHVMTGVMIHQGKANEPQSAGCLNLSSQSKVYPEFVKAVGNGTEGRLVVLDANEK